MCGIAGAFKAPTADVGKMLDLIQHRGPDAKGLKEEGQGIYGHVRLSLRDLSSASDQPFVTDRGSVLCFNGEIWNWRELRSLLEDLNYDFQTTGDTEVLANLLDHYGVEEALKKVRGMFAFSWHSNTEQVLGRDAFGEIPIYLASTKTGFIWASERKAFVGAGIPKGRPEALKPGYILDLSKRQLRKWYSIKKYSNQVSPTSITTMLDRGVRERMDSDAKTGVLISGGLDSSIILALACRQLGANNVTAFTSVFDESSEDLAAARKLCKWLGVKLIEAYTLVTEKAIHDSMDTVEIASKVQIEIGVLCMPLAQKVREAGFKAVLSGEAADELFGGYGNFCIWASSHKNDPSAIRERRLAELHKMSRGNFVRCNKVFMSKGVEIRLPFMDQELVEAATSMDLTQSPTGKKILKDSAQKYLPEWVGKRVKQTFQGGSGVSEYIIKRLIKNPLKFYNSEMKKKYGYLPKE